MKRIRFFLIVVGLTFLLTACDGRGVYSGTLILDGDEIVQPEQVEVAEIFLLNGTLTVAESARLDGNIYQFLTLDDCFSIFLHIKTKKPPVFQSDQVAFLFAAIFRRELLSVVAVKSSFREFNHVEIKFLQKGWH